MTKLFDGFYNPQENWSKMPHQLIEALHLIPSVSELKVVLYILRHTWGYSDDDKRITVDEFCNGRKRKDGTRIDNGTGLTEPSVRNGLVAASEHGFIEVDIDDKDKARIKKYYRLSIQGEKVLPSDSKSFTLRHEKVLPRTEKETKERKKEKELPSGEDKPKSIHHLLLEIILHGSYSIIYDPLNPPGKRVMATAGMAASELKAVGATPESMKRFYDQWAEDYHIPRDSVKLAASFSEWWQGQQATPPAPEKSTESVVDRPSNFNPFGE